MIRSASSQSAPKKSEQRRFPRRAKSIRFQFEQNGEQYCAVTTIVGIGGAFVKASVVPRPGSVVTLRERFNPAGVEIAVRCEVVWGIDRPSLERPDTGFGFRIQEVATQADPGHLEDFLRSLDPAYKSIPGTDIAYEERTSGVYAIFRVPEIMARGEFFSDEDLSPANADELVELDLHAELDRLRRTEAIPPPAADSPSPLTPGFNTRQTVPVGMPAFQDPPGDPLLDPDDDSRPRNKRRSVTGIFTAIFGRPKLEAEAAEAAAPALPDAPTRPGGGGTHGAMAVREARRPAMVVSWGASTLVGRIDQLTAQQGAFWTTDTAPALGTQVVLRPAGATAPFDALAIHASVIERSARPRGGGFRVVVVVARIDEQGRPGRFAEYLRFIAPELAGR